LVWTIRKKILAFLVIDTVIFAALFAVLFIIISQLEKNYRTKFMQTFEQFSVARNLYNNINKQNIILLNHFLTPDQSNVTELSVVKDDIYKDINYLYNTLEDIPCRQRLLTIQLMVDNYEHQLSIAMKIFDTRGQKEAKQFLNYDSFINMTEDEIRKLLEIQKKSIDELISNTSSNLKIIRLIFFIISIIALLLSLYISKIIKLNIISPINKISNGVQKFTDGDFNYRIKIRSNDEFNYIANAFNIMAEKISSSFYQVDSTNKLLEKNLDELSLVQKNLIASENRFRSLVSNIPGAVIRGSFNDNMHIEYANDEIFSLTGYTLDDFITRKAVYSDLIIPEDRYFLIKNVNEAVDKQSNYSREYRLVTKDGRLKWVIEKGQGYYNTDGKLYIDAVVFDISDKKKFEEIEKANLYYLEGMDKISKIISKFSSLDDFVKNVFKVVKQIFKSDGCWMIIPTDENKTNAKIYYYGTDEGKFDIFYKTDYPIDDIVREILINCSNTNLPVVYDDKLAVQLKLIKQTENISQMFISIKSTSSFEIIIGIHNQNNIIEWSFEKQKLFQDISVRIVDVVSGIVLTQNLKESEKKYRTLFDELQDLFFQTDNSGNLIMVSPSCKTLIGYDQDELIGKNVFTQIRTRQEFKDRLYELANSNQPVEEFEIPILCKNGDEIWLSIHFQNFFDESGYKAGIRGMARNVSIRKAAEDQIKKMNVELEHRVEERTSELISANVELRHTLQHLQIAQTQLIQTEKMAALGSLVAGVAHEINTPIGIGVTATSHLKKITEKLKEQYEANSIRKNDLDDFIKNTFDSCDIILANIWRASEIITSFKHVAVDQSSEQRREFNIKQYINEILISLHPKIKKTPHKIIVECDEKISINNYPGAFSQIITNLIINSLIHAFPGEAIGEIIIRVALIDGIINMDYSDNGNGIPSENVGKIFDPFFTTKRGQGGTGLGLNIVFNIISQKLKGGISVESELGKGTSFHINFPA